MALSPIRKQQLLRAEAEKRKQAEAAKPQGAAPVPAAQKATDTKDLSKPQDVREALETLPDHELRAKAKVLGLLKMNMGREDLIKALLDAGVKG